MHCVDPNSKYKYPAHHRHSSSSLRDAVAVEQRRAAPGLESLSSMKNRFTFPKIRRRYGDEDDAEDRVREVQIRNRAVLPRAIPTSTVIVRFDLSAKQQYMFGTRLHLLVPHSLQVPQHTFVCDCV
jgi:hypothetical protein